MNLRALLFVLALSAPLTTFADLGFKLGDVYIDFDHGDVDVYVGKHHHKRRHHHKPRPKPYNCKAKMRKLSHQCEDIYKPRRKARCYENGLYRIKEHAPKFCRRTAGQILRNCDDRRRGRAFCYSRAVDNYLYDDYVDYDRRPHRGGRRH